MQKRVCGQVFYSLGRRTFNKVGTNLLQMKRNKMNLRQTMKFSAHHIIADNKEGSDKMEYIIQKYYNKLNLNTVVFLHQA